MSHIHSNQLQAQFDLEKELARTLMNASKQSRKGLYTTLYERFYEEISEDLRNAMNPTAAEAEYIVDLKMKTLKPWLNKKDLTFLEIGAGNGYLAQHIAPSVEHVIVVEASDNILFKKEKPSNALVLITDMPPYSSIESSTVDLAFSSHFIEHLHPEDAIAHFREMHRILKRGGAYLCITPHRMYGPHDVSKHFVKKRAEGLHLQEYSYASLAKSARQAGFPTINAIIRIGDRPGFLDFYLATALEKIIAWLPVSLTKMIGNKIFTDYKEPFRPLEQIKLVVYK